MSNANEIALEVFNIWRDQLEKFADIRIKYGEIIWMNTNIVTSGARLVGEFPADEYIQKLEIEDISPNLKEKFNGKITHKIQLKPPYNEENTYVHLDRNQLIDLGFIDKPKSFMKRLIGSYKLILGLFGFIALVLGLLTDGFGLYDRIKVNQSEKTDSLEIKSSKYVDQSEILLDSSEVLRTDSLYNRPKE